MQAPQQFANWLQANSHTDPIGNTYNYHPRSDTHSKALCKYILDDLLQACPVLVSQMAGGQVIYNINFMHTWPNSHKAKTIDLAIGKPVPGSPMQFMPLSHPAYRGQIGEVFISCEAKAVMTEHGKAQPRVFDELTSSHHIVHQGRVDAIAAGICVINIARSFASPLRNRSLGITNITQHNQPNAAQSVMQHLRGLAIANAVGQHGFDAYCTFMVDVDNLGHATLHTAPPAPQPGDPDHYDTFIQKIVRCYTSRFSVIP